MTFSQIVVTPDLDKSLDDVCQKLDSTFVIFPKPFKEQADFLVEDADEMIEEAYMGEEGGKWIITKAVQYRLEAQNRLLKLIEEPPSGVKFIILVKHKSYILQTIRSRLPISIHKGLKTKESWTHPGSSTELANLLKESESWDKAKAQLKLAALLEFVSTHNNFKINLERFDKAYVLLSLNARVNIIFASLLGDLKKVG